MLEYGFDNKATVWKMIDRYWPWFWAITTKLVMDSETEIERLCQQPCTSYIRAKITQYKEMMANRVKEAGPIIANIKE